MKQISKVAHEDVLNRKATRTRQMCTLPGGSAEKQGVALSQRKASLRK